MVLPMRVRMMGMVRLRMMVMEHQVRAPMMDMEHQRILAMGHQVKVLTTVMEHHLRVLIMAMEPPPTLATGPPRRAQTTATVHHQILAMGHQRKVQTQAMARHHKAMVPQHRVLMRDTGLLHEEKAEKRIREAGGRAAGKATREGEKVEAHLQVTEVQHKAQTLAMVPPLRVQRLVMEHPLTRDMV